MSLINLLKFHITLKFLIKKAVFNNFPKFCFLITKFFLFIIFNTESQKKKKMRQKKKLFTERKSLINNNNKSERIKLFTINDK